MSLPRLLITGKSKFTETICDRFAENSRAISRKSGHDIENPEVRLSIAQMSLEYDIFVNHVHSGHFCGQTELLYAVYSAWKAQNKTGLIVNTGSFGTFRPAREYQRWTVVKRGLDIANRQCCNEIQAQALPFRMCNLRPGTLDTELSRSKAHWPGVGVSAEDYAEMIDCIYNLPSHLLVHEFVVTAKLTDHASAGSRI